MAPATPATPADLLRVALAADSRRPALTYYDDADGERVELSVATVANWVAKTANLLQDELGVEPGDRVVVLLPLHWQTAIVLLGAWSVGALVTDRLPGDVACCGPQITARGTRETLAFALRPFGTGFPEPPPAGTRDFAAEALAMPDTFAPVVLVDPDAPALATAAGTATARDLVAAARAAPLANGARVLTTLPYTTLPAVTAGLLGPLAHAGGAVLCRRPPAASALTRRAEVERVTATAGVDLPGLPRLA